MFILCFGERIIIFLRGDLKNRKVWQRNFLLHKCAVGNYLLLFSEKSDKISFLKKSKNMKKGVDKRRTV